ncbi:MAG TPA: sterol desaturase family protein [Candidatus Acidoferrum sp.]|nr:sterol desaturase family protein [Candidatus Acidoferrum sp.]
MLYQRLHTIFIGIVATLLDSVVVAEFAGYWLHRLLYSDRFPTLSRGHLIHHFLVDGPWQPMRAGKYHDATEGCFFIDNVGIEWLGPSAIILLLCWAVMVLLGVPPIYQVIAPCTLLGWAILMFSYRRDRTHTENCRMSRVPLLKARFLRARGLHDIHHHSVASQGYKDPNFGIGFYFFDRLFRTMAKRHRRFNWAGYKTAIERYGLDEAELASLRRCSKALFQRDGRQ